MASGEALKFVLELVDKVSGSAKRIESALERIERRMEKLERAAERGLDRPAKSADSFLTKLTGINSGFSLASKGIDIFTGIASAAFSAAAAVGQVAFEAGKFALQAASFKEDTMAAFEVILGSKEAAEKQFQFGIDFAAKTPFGAKDFSDLQQTLLGAGFKVEDIPALASAIGDIAALKPGDSTALGRIVTQLGQMRSQGKVLLSDLKPIFEVGIIGAQDFYGAIAEAMGKSVEEVKKLQSEGKLSSDWGIFGILAAVEKKVGTLGTVMERRSQTLSGLWSTLESRPLEMLMDLADSPAFADAKGFVKNLADAFDPKTAAGGKIKARLEQFTERAFGFVFGGLAKAGPDQIADFVTSAIDVIEEAWGVVEGIFRDIKTWIEERGGGDFGKGIKTLLGDVRNFVVKTAELIAKSVEIMMPILDFVAKFIPKPGQTWSDAGKEGSRGAWDWLTKPTEGGLFDRAVGETWGAAMDSVWDFLWTDTRVALGLRGAEAFDGIGLQMTAGLVAGMTAGQAQVEAAAARMVEGAATAAKDAAEIHSPSRVFEYFGLMSAAGLAQGMELGAGDVDAAAAAMLPAPRDFAWLSGAAAGGGMRGASVTVQVGPFEVSGASSPAETAAQIREMVVAGLLDTFEQLGVEIGVEPR
jgi:tape measure domain-containing protein